MSKTVNVHIVEENRANVVNFGSLYGKRIFKVVKDPVILDFNKRATESKENNGLFLDRNVFRYRVVAIDITGLNLEKDIDGEHVIVINKDQEDDKGNSLEIRCSLANKKFTKDVSVEDVTTALNAGEATKNIFFSNGKKLAEFMNRQNEKESTKVALLREELSKIENMLSRTSEKNISDTESYYRQLDGKAADVNVNIDINV